MASGAELLAAGWAALQSGQAGEAERLCREALRAEPAGHSHSSSAESWFLLGTACLCQNRPAEAAEHYARALHLRPDLPEAHNNLGSALRALGRTDEAADCFRRALDLWPDYPEAHHNLGVALRDLGRAGEALACHRRALELRPNYPEAHTSLGNAFYDLGRLAEAEASYREALGLRPDLPDALLNLGGALRGQGRLAEAAESYTRIVRLYADLPEGHNNLGSVLQEESRPQEAERCFQRALELRPDYPEALNNLGNLRRDQGRSDEAADCYRRTLQLRPDSPEVLINLGNTLQTLARPGEAVECYQQVLALRPDSPEALNNLGNALRGLGRSGEAVECYRQALRLRPDYPQAHNNLGVAAHGQGRHGEAVECYTRSLRLRPDDPETHNNLGIALWELGRTEEAIDSFRQALRLRPDYAAAHSGLLMTLHYKASVTPAELSNAHAEYQDCHAASLRAFWRPFANGRDPERPLRLGFVSPDFGRHPVGYFFVRAAETLARRRCEVFYYSSRAATDDYTARFQAAATAWRDVAGIGDEQLAEQVRADGIDVLIDLAGHTAGNRLLALARRPAPVQATWLGYVGTTGLEAIDYLIADVYLVPQGSECHHRERVLRLPGSHTCYDAPAYAPDPGPPPALASGRVTFGCFNNPAKLSTPALAAFAAVLRRVPASRLVLKYRGLDNLAVADRVLGLLADGGISPERVELRGRSAHAEHLAAYRDIDIALDPFPYAGVMTTCDALWMGVPVVTLPGDTFASRHGLGLLSVVGVADELAARDVDDYAQRAAGLAEDLGRLTKLRAALRGRMARSTLCDGERLADELLAVVRIAWRAWATDAGSVDH